MKNVLIYAMDFDEAKIAENIEKIFSGRSFEIDLIGKNFNIKYKKIFGSESFRIKITGGCDPSYMIMKEAARKLYSDKNCDDERVRDFVLNYLDKTEAYVEIKCEKDYSGLLDELFIKLTASYKGAALLDNGALIDADGMVILFEDGEPGDSVLLDFLNHNEEDYPLFNCRGPKQDDSSLPAYRKTGTSLPRISLPDGFKFPTKDEIIGRACAHLLISCYASDVAMAEPIRESRDFYEGLIKKYEIEEYLSEPELSLLYRDNVSIGECFEQISDFDKAAVLMWFLSLTDHNVLFPLGEGVNYRKLLTVLASFEDFDSLYDSSKIKSSGELLNLACKLQAAYTDAADPQIQKTIANKYAGILWLCRIEAEQGPAGKPPM